MNTRSIGAGTSCCAALHLFSNTRTSHIRAEPRTTDRPFFHFQPYLWSRSKSLLLRGIFFSENHSHADNKHRRVTKTSRVYGHVYNRRTDRNSASIDRHSTILTRERRGKRKELQCHALSFLRFPTIIAKFCVCVRRVKTSDRT